MPESVHKEQLQSLPKVVVERLKAAIGDKHVLTDPDELFVYEADALRTACRSLCRVRL